MAICRLKIEAAKKSGIERRFSRKKIVGGSVVLEVYATELTRTISHSKEVEDMLAALNRSSAVIEFSLDGIVLNANDNFFNGVGDSKSQIIGKHHRMFCDQKEAGAQSYKAHKALVLSTEAGNVMNDIQTGKPSCGCY